MGDLASVKRFVESGANVDTRTWLTHETPLHLAARNGHADVVKYLLEHRAAVNTRDEGGATPLHSASRAGHLKVMEALLAGGADVSEKGTGCGPPLQWAAQAGQIDAAKVLLEHRADIDQAGTDGSTPLMAAVSAGQTEMVKFLLERKAAANARAAYGLTALHAAAYADRADIARMLIAHGADPNLECNGRTAFQIARSEGFRRALRGEAPTTRPVQPTTRSASGGAKPDDPESLRVELNALIQRKAPLDDELAKARRMVGPKHPQARQLEAQVQYLDHQIEALKQRLLDAYAQQDATCYISGVPSPGAYKFGNQPVTLLQALIAARLDPNAEKDKYILIIRRNIDGKTEATDSFRVSELLSNRSKDIDLHAGDTIIISTDPPAHPAAVTRPAVRPR